MCSRIIGCLVSVVVKWQSFCLETSITISGWIFFFFKKGRQRLQHVLHLLEECFYLWVCLNAFLKKIKYKYCNMAAFKLM